MTIETNRNSHTPFSIKHNIQSRVSFKEILDEFKSLEDLANTLDDNMSICGVEKDKEVKQDYKRYLQLQDFRRPKLQECAMQGSNKFVKMNRSYSLQEIKEKGLQITPTTRLMQSNTQNHTLILSEFIL